MSVFDLSPRHEANIRGAKLPAAGLMSWKCAQCKRPVFEMAGRKKCKTGGWVCARCVNQAGQ